MADNSILNMMLFYKALNLLEDKCHQEEAEFDNRILGEAGKELITPKPNSMKIHTLTNILLTWCENDYKFVNNLLGIIHELMSLAHQSGKKAGLTDEEYQVWKDIVLQTHK